MSLKEEYKDEYDKLFNTYLMDSNIFETSTGTAKYYPVGDLIDSGGITSQQVTISEPDKIIGPISKYYNYNEYTAYYDQGSGADWDGITDIEISEWNSKMNNKLGDSYYHINFSYPYHINYHIYVKRYNNSVLFTYYIKKNFGIEQKHDILPRFKSRIITKKIPIMVKSNIFNEPECKEWSDNTHGLNNYTSINSNNIETCTPKDPLYNSVMTFSTPIGKYTKQEEQYKAFNVFFGEFDIINSKIETEKIIETGKITTKNTCNSNLSDLKNEYIGTVKPKYNESNTIKENIESEIQQIEDDIVIKEQEYETCDNSLQSHILNVSSCLANYNARSNVKETKIKENEVLAEEYAYLLTEEERLKNENKEYRAYILSSKKNLNILSSDIENKNNSVNLNINTVDINDINDPNCINYKGCYKNYLNSSFIKGKYVKIEIPKHNKKFKILQIKIFNNESDIKNIATDTHITQSSISHQNLPLSPECIFSSNYSESNDINEYIESNAYCAINGDSIINGAIFDHEQDNHWIEIDLTKTYYNKIKPYFYNDEYNELNKYYNISSIQVYYKFEDNTVIEQDLLNYTIKILDNSKNILYQINESSGTKAISNNIYEIIHNIIDISSNKTIDNLQPTILEDMSFNKCKRKAQQMGDPYFAVTNDTNGTSKCLYWKKDFDSTIGKLGDEYKGECNNTTNNGRRIGSENEYAIYSINNTKCLKKNIQENFGNNNKNNKNNNNCMLSITLIILLIFFYIKYKK